MTVKLECRIRQNAQQPVKIEFPDKVLDIELNEPCPGCRWRQVIDFDPDPQLEKYIGSGVRVTELERSEAVRLFQYLELKETVGKLAKMGHIYKWENLQVTRYPNMDNRIACWVKGAGEEMVTF